MAAFSSCTLEGTAGGWRECFVRTKAKYLGTMSTIADAEALAVSIAWETCAVVALDSKGVVERIQGLTHNQPRSWIEERLVRQMIERPKTLMWVKAMMVWKGMNRRMRGRSRRYG